MRLLLMSAIICIANVAGAVVSDRQELRPFGDIEQEQQVMSFLGVARDHYDDDWRCRRYGDCRRYPDRPGRPPGRPGYPGHPGYPPDRPGRSEYVCYTENARRQVFWARDRSPRWAQRVATDQCYRYSRYCYEMGCREIR